MANDNLRIAGEGYRHALEKQSANCKEFESLSKKKRKLGIILKATINGETGVCRKIEWDRITNYTMESYFMDLARLKQLDMANYLLTPIAGKVNDTMYLYSEKMKSLHEVLHFDKDELTLEVKRKLVKTIGKILFTLQ